jgi:hypothetical protein
MDLESSEKYYDQCRVAYNIWIISCYIYDEDL